MISDDQLVRAAVRSVLDGASLAERSPPGDFAVKGHPRDLVTQVDRRVQALMQAQLQEGTGVPVVAEEDDTSPDALPPACWAVDPIDGTANFFNELPLFCVSAGLVRERAFAIGAVCAPRLNQLFFTLDETRALFNGRPVRHEARPLAQSLAAASFPARADDRGYATFRRVNEETRGCLRTGSAALNVCWVAANRLQGALGFGARVWDVAGALAVARVAGCALRVRWRSATELDYCVGSAEFVERYASDAE